MGAIIGVSANPLGASSPDLISAKASPTCSVTLDRNGGPRLPLAEAGNRPSRGGLNCNGLGLETL
jgi:hypothetical protein